MSKKSNQAEEVVAPTEELLTAVEGEENVNVTPVEPEAPLEVEPEVSAETEPQVPSEEDATPVAQEPETSTAPEVPQESVEPVVAPEPTPEPTPVANPGADIAAAITEGLKGAGGRKGFRITADKSVTPRFAVVRSRRTGDIMLRENETGVLSKVQLESLEEKEASIQGEEVEEV